MAHYAKINDDNVVERVEVLDDFYEWSDTGELDENRAVATLKKFFGDNTTWKKTSYNNNIRGNYAGIGFTWDEENDEFIPPKPYASWTYSFTDHQWKAPLDHPLADISEDSTDQPEEITSKPDDEVWEYVWNEDAYQADNTKGWEFKLIWASEDNDSGIDLSE